MDNTCGTRGGLETKADSGLVCKLGDDQCINPIRGDETGDIGRRMGVMTTLM